MRGTSPFVVAVLVALLLVFSNATLATAQEQPPAPHVFLGTASILDAETLMPAPDGAEVFAGIGSYTSDSVLVSNGRYIALNVIPPATISSGTVTFFMRFDGQEFRALQTYSYRKIFVPDLFTLNLTFVRTSAALSLQPPPPETVTRRAQVPITVTVTLGQLMMTGGAVQVTFDPQVFQVLEHQVGNLLEDTTEQVAAAEGSFSISWVFPSPTGTLPPSGILVSIPLQVRNAAPGGVASVDVQVSLTYTGGVSATTDLSFSLSVAGIVADFNSDGEVDIVDLAALGVFWGTQEGQPGFEAKFDLDDDGVVAEGDLAVFVQNYGSTQ